MDVSGRGKIEELHHKGDEPHLLREIVRTHQVLMNGFTRQVGIPSSRFVLMRLLALAAPGSVGIMEIARQLDVNAAAVTRLVKEMEEKRLVLRRADPGDGRRSYVRLSARGMQVFENLHNQSHGLERALSSVITAEEMTVAVKVLRALRSFVEGSATREA
jgi:DNA-binding MarR family transcriptional regulator